VRSAVLASLTIVGHGRIALFLLGDAVPKPLGFIAFTPEWQLQGRLAPPRHSGRWVGAPVASLRCRIFRPGHASINSRPLRRQRNLLQSSLARYKYSCPGSAPLAGFEVTLIGRFSGDHRGDSNRPIGRSPVARNLLNNREIHFRICSKDIFAPITRLGNSDSPHEERARERLRARPRLCSAELRGSLNSI
jgi:hypothetical protein